LSPFVQQSREYIFDGLFIKTFVLFKLSGKLQPSVQHVQVLQSTTATLQIG